MKTKLAILLILTFVLSAKAQKVDTVKKTDQPPRTQLAALVGYNLQKNSFAEIGIGIYRRGWIDYLPFLSSVSVSDEILIGNRFVMGPKIGSFFNFFSTPVGFGLNLIDYTDFTNSALRFRPEIGFGALGTRIVYGYNFTLTNANFGNINTHNFGMVVMFP